MFHIFFESLVIFFNEHSIFFHPAVCSHPKQPVGYTREHSHGAEQQLGCKLLHYNLNSQAGILRRAGFIIEIFAALDEKEKEETIAA